ncbi:MAG: 16S rRNA (adenine(1518)-N(6)/adenine(1519)-N(6))-dimethyltransferase RsmA [Flavobacteriales bacterium]|nr:16S rRNA (adenine(1518)-N(6)/adenine(1519)-N(6))-dimethyltransferase RsmA [Flavobacteriales bacterium]MBL6872588.1 16S rRNA (adenine(1518)-N(6)/adenine(1519)-N(6))-dimethyltransferase RsmA [Flavobacteriales bacterium]
MSKVRAKKHLGQHFLTDLEIAQNIAYSLDTNRHQSILEVGPGMGVLTKYLLNLDSEVFVIEIDKESVRYLKNHFPKLENHIIEGDFLQLPIEEIFDDKVGIIGNFPYNISSQILFKALDHKNTITEIVGMFQKEVAERVASPPGKKAYGIISVLLQCYYDIEYLFTVNEDVFDPPPKVKSAVIRLRRNQRKDLPCDEKKFIRTVKTAFSMRRKTLRNALKSLNLVDEIKAKKFLDLRAEQLSVEDFFELTDCFE